MAKKKRGDDAADSRALLGDQLNFAAAEAYKLLRTNLQFSLPAGSGCRVIGITSSLRSEGKSTTAINLAYTIAQAEKKVLLLEADMRIATVARRLDLSPSPGLSNLLVGLSTGAEVMQPSGLLPKLSVITAGDVPPNPSELLSSEQMAVTIQTLSKEFQYILLDLPPISVVSDSLAVCKLLDGMIVVVRRDYCSRPILSETMRQLSQSEVKLLGFVMTRSHGHGKKYGKYSKKYAKTYGYGYGYDTVSEQAARTDKSTPPPPPPPR
ncbi:MAG: CpsD/CapB family tyrosine-protein kinase [Oscillospiraceae bacterium]|nr:CpsD/CapB family tyrosine-protein kinase [Oscillospiraceae bacterium]